MIENKKLSEESILKIVVGIFVVACLSHFCIHMHQYRISKPMQDVEYKKSIIKSSHNLFYRLENLRNLVGEEELTQFIISNDNNPGIYTPSRENRSNGVYRATLHMHTTNSDGQSSIENYLQRAQSYAEQKLRPDEYVYIAITDHNTVLGAKELIKVLQSSAESFPNVKVIAGMEVNSKFYNTTVSKEPVEIHTLVLCINPYDKYLNKEFYKRDLKDQLNNKQPERDFEWLVYTMSGYGIPGIAHPATYTEYLGYKKLSHIVELFDKYKAVTKKVPFVEAYYQTYPKKYYDKDSEASDYYQFIQKAASDRGIMRTGSTDSHGVSIFDRL